MKKSCQNDPCGNEAMTNVPVSLHTPSDQTRTLCSACEQAYRLGVRHGRMRPKSRKVWVLAVTDRGTVVYGRVLRTKRRAIADLAQYLKTHEGYDGRADMPSISSWLAEFDERMGIDLFPARLEID